MSENDLLVQAVAKYSIPDIFHHDWHEVASEMPGSVRQRYRRADILSTESATDAMISSYYMCPDTTVHMCPDPTIYASLYGTNQTSMLLTKPLCCQLNLYVANRGSAYATN